MKTKCLKNGRFGGNGGLGLGERAGNEWGFGHAKYGENRSDMEIIRFVVLILPDCI